MRWAALAGFGCFEADVADPLWRTDLERIGVGWDMESVRVRAAGSMSGIAVAGVGAPGCITLSGAASESLDACTVSERLGVSDRLS